MNYRNSGVGQAIRLRERVFQRRLDSEVARELGGSSVSILLDQEKCHEMVPFSCLWQEAFPLGSYSRCVGWSYRAMVSFV